MSVSRLAAAAVLIVLVVTTGAGASTRANAAAPTGLHAFLLRADEPAKTSFSRTPAFAWNPTDGTDHYEFQLSTSDTFRDNAVIWSTSTLQSPVAAPSVSLPWITGSPHSLYARTRAVLSDGTISPWSADFGFDVVPPPPPTPLPSAPGLLRWTPVEGADGYEVWLIDLPKTEVSFSNVLDERELYTFHQANQWTGTLRWRIRALRDDMLGRLNGVPVTQYGAWSPIYVSTNPAVTGGQIHLGSTISDVVTNGAASDPAHRLMPAFTWTGNQSLQGAAAELFRVYVFTDSQCLNRVYTSAVVGSPAYSGRAFGPLSLPTTATAVTGARTSYLPDGSEPQGATYDGQPLTSSEAVADAKPTTTLPLASTSPSGTTGGTTSPTPSGGQSASFMDWGSSKFGAPVDLWDTNWPSGGYYWTVVPVGAVSPGALQTTVAAPGGIAAATTLPVASSVGFAPGDQVTVGNAANSESVVITAVDANSISLAAPLKLTHGTGEPVVRTGGSIRYLDMELPQDVCAAGRVARFGVSSEPSLTGGGDAFASGLSSSGTLVSATQTGAFYRPPLVAWTPALRSEAYQIQWSKTKYPFVPEADPVTGAAGILTASTSYVLPVAAGTWYYRVRGYDYSLPTGSQQMGWSDLAKIVVAKPTFVIVGSTGSASVKKTSSSMRIYNKGSFSISVPKTWSELKAQDSIYLFMARDRHVLNNVRATANVLQASGRGSRTMSSWAASLKAQVSKLAYGSVSTHVVAEPAGQAVLLSYAAKLKSGALIAVRQYAFDTGAQAYLVTLTAPASRLALFSKTFASVAASFSAS